MSKEELERVLGSAGFVVRPPDGLSDVEFIEVEGQVLAAHLDPETLRITNWWRRQDAYTHEATADELRAMVGEAQVLLSTQSP